MIRFLVWLFVGVIIANLLKMFRVGKQIRRSAEPDPPDVRIPPFQNISDAEFEDITSKPPTSDNPSTKG